MSRLSVRDLAGILSLALAVCAAALVWGVSDRSREAIRELANAVQPDLLIVRLDPFHCFFLPYPKARQFECAQVSRLHEGERQLLI